MSTEAIAVGRQELRRAIDWRGAFWVASGVPALVLFSIGGIAGTTGKLAFLVWIISMIMGFLQSFTYAEIAGLFANKSGGASVYGATAWLRYSKFIAPLSVWCNWFAWSPVLSLGCAIAAGYILNALCPDPGVDSPAVKDWIAAHASAIAADIARGSSSGSPPMPARRRAMPSRPCCRPMPCGPHAGDPQLDAASFNIPGLATAHLNATFFIGAVLMLIIFAIQHRGILSTANVQKVVGSIVHRAAADRRRRADLHRPDQLGQLSPIWCRRRPPIRPSRGLEQSAAGRCSSAASSSRRGRPTRFETAVCYTREFKNPQTDTFKAIFYSGLLCLFFFTSCPSPSRACSASSGHARTRRSSMAPASPMRLAGMVGGGNFIHALLVVLMILALILAIMTAMAGSSRTLYQGSVDGWLPRYLHHVNEHGAPTRAMWTDLGFNLFLLAIASDVSGYFFVLAVSNVGYMIFNFLNLNAGWIHRIDSGHVPTAVEGAQLADRPQHGARLRQCAVPRRRRQGLGLCQCAVGRLRLCGADHAGVRAAATISRMAAASRPTRWRISGSRAAIWASARPACCPIWRSPPAWWWCCWRTGISSFHRDGSRPLPMPSCLGGPTGSRVISG